MPSEAPETHESIGETERIYRRIPSALYDPESGVALTAFRPNERDTEGLSASRSGLGRTAEQEGMSGRPGKEYYVAELDASQVLNRGIKVAHKPVVDNPSHIEFPAITYDRRKDNDAMEAMEQLRQSVVNVLGPFRVPEDGSR